MANWTNIADAVLQVDKPVRSIDALALRDNIIAIMEKAAGAPVLANSYVVEAMLAAGAVAQGKLKTALNSTAVGGGGGSSTGQVVLAGGEYCFVPTANIAAGSGVDNIGFFAGGGLATSGLPLFNLEVGGVGQVQAMTGTTATRGTPYTLLSWAEQADDPITLNVRYVNASPPYDLGEGEVPLFVFVNLDKSGNVKAVWSAIDPPWAHNGPTNITPHWEDPKTGRKFRFERQVTDADRLALKNPLLRAEALVRMKAQPFELFEITQARKQRDMPLIPHPFVSAGVDDVVVMLPLGSTLDDLTACYHCEENIGELILRGYIQISNEPLNAIAPPGVLAVEADWKLTS